jgi:hypothetical protein
VSALRFLALWLRKTEPAGPSLCRFCEVASYLEEDRIPDNLVLAASWHRRCPGCPGPDRSHMPADDQRVHPHVPHPVRLRMHRDRAGAGKITLANDWAATHLGIFFGSVWVVWAFFIWPLAAQYLNTEVQVKTSYYAQSWVQLFALPLFVYIGNRLQRSSDAQSDAQHEAMTHIATVSDQNAELLKQNTDLTAQIHQMATQIQHLLET